MRNGQQFYITCNVVIFVSRYNFQPIQRYKALSAEEADEEFGR